MICLSFWFFKTSTKFILSPYLYSNSGQTQIHFIFEKSVKKCTVNEQYRSIQVREKTEDLFQKNTTAVYNEILIFPKIKDLTTAEQNSGVCVHGCQFNDVSKSLHREDSQFLKSMVSRHEKYVLHQSRHTAIGGTGSISRMFLW